MFISKKIFFRKINTLIYLIKYYFLIFKLRIQYRNFVIKGRHVLGIDALKTVKQFFYENNQGESKVKIRCVKKKRKKKVVYKNDNCFHVWGAYKVSDSLVDSLQIHICHCGELYIPP